MGYIHIDNLYKDVTKCISHKTVQLFKQKILNDLESNLKK